MSNLLEKIKYLRELEAKATPLGWEVDSGETVAFIKDEGEICVLIEHGNGFATDADHKLICESRNALPEILDALEHALRFIGTTCDCYERFGDCLNCAFLKKYGIGE